MKKIIIAALLLTATTQSNATINPVYPDSVPQITMQDDANTCKMGTKDAEYFHGKVLDHYIYGAAFGLLSIAGTAISNPTPEKGQHTMQKSQYTQYMNDPEYLKCYKKQAKKQNINNELKGWSVWLVIFLVF